MLRPDGSVRSANLPVAANRHPIRDYGVYRGVIRDVIYTDDERNDSGGGTPNEIVYTVMVVGGERDGQIFQNARLMRGMGGYRNFELKVLKAAEGISQADIASLEARADPSISNISTLNGDVVYIQFVNGDLHLPLIIGFGYHQLADTEPTSDDGVKFSKGRNGIIWEIDKDGNYTWTKDNGAFVPFLPTDPSNPYVNEFAPFPGQDGAVTVTLGNQYDFEFAYNTGLSFTIDGVKDEYSLGTKVGTTLTISGTEDSFELSTSAGATYALSGLTDSHDFTTIKGTELKIDGVADSIELSVAFGDSISVSAKDGIQMSTPAGGGNTISMKSGAIELTSGGQAVLTLDKTGFVALGNSSGDIFKDVLAQLLQALTTEAPAGFGAPLVNLATYVQLVAKLQAIIGG